MEQCPFCQLISNKENLMVVAESPDLIAFLDINPRSRGHTLITPKEHVRSFEDFKGDGALIKLIGEISAKIKSKLGASGVSLVANDGEMAGSRVPHLTFQLFPRYENEETKGVPAGAIFKPVKMKEDEIKETWLKLKGDYKPGPKKAEKKEAITQEKVVEPKKEAEAPQEVSKEDAYSEVVQEMQVDETNDVNLVREVPKEKVKEKTVQPKKKWKNVEFK